MADRSKCDLPYGQYGRIAYQPHDKTLSFGRRIQLPTVVTALGGPKVIEHPPHADHLFGNVRDGEPKGKRHARQVKALVEAFPELEPAVDLLPPLLQVSETVEDAQSRHDPSAGSIVAFANIRSQAGHRAVPVVAMRTGVTGCTLRVAQLEMQRHGWAEDKTTWLEMPVLGSDQTTWSSSAGVIQQLLFAEETENRDTLLAVRLPTKVIVFRILIAKGSVKAGTPSGLKLDMIFESDGNLPSQRTYMDIAFNPWFSQQIAVIDSAGEWQVLEVSLRKARQYSVVCKSASQDNNDRAAIADGWARIAWVSDVATVATCSRQRVALHSIRDAESVMLKQVPLQLTGAVPWVLGFVRLPSQMQRLAVLTSTHLVLCHITRTELGVLRINAELKVRHYQNTDDLSLRITSFANDENDVRSHGVIEPSIDCRKVLVLGVYSNMHSTLIMYQLSRSSAGQLVSSDPYHLTVPSSGTQASPAEHVRDLHFRLLRLCPKHGTGASYAVQQSSSDAQYHTLMVIRSNGVIEETLFHTQTNRDQLSAGTPATTSWTTKPVLRTTKLGFLDAMVGDSAFQSGDAREHRAEPLALRARRPGKSQMPQQAFLDLESLADALNQPTSRDWTMEDAVSEIKSIVSSAVPNSQHTMHTLDHLVGSELLVDEVERASTELEHLFSTLARTNEEHEDGPASGLQLETISLPAATNSYPEPELSSLSTAYERVVSHWITVLPSQIAGRIRLAKREGACRIAAELILASRRLRPASELPHRGILSPGKESHNPVETWDLPVRATRTALPSFSSSSSMPKPSTQPSSLPTPSPTATPSITTASSRVSTAAPQLDRLAAYTSFIKPSPLVLPRALSNVLSHWEVGSDPHEYDWMSKSRHISQVDDDETQGLTEKERQRAQRQAERHLRRQRKEAAASQASQMASSQAVDIISTSQNSLPDTYSQRAGASKTSQTESQSQSQGRDAVASQIIRGPHGGRPLAKRRKKGF
ncbi:hypothetical protein CLAFUW4_01715 [Fulvia fulva]|uniref:uncharacterized protein n=1 Tax=Passalora fulva TaxID=5499 RepID=UPI0028528197|nr:uncharacterized protein CLAFUR5_20132 [Fulvia fulva]KAK4636315.1 hypothetical protein CLAFUR4_01713 [Fulvia fulva]KAK4637854.1 hypothetical protein CLAFUR0_01714 [Fulvia fulva]WMI38764.1 hypothetical protein CLAFUR5_20132 [Fulvia fulva]WPV09788.1 hypothetical protein CLAFUW4_01715 [Fulvia fulva]WPV23392.1 hypothetical protein CLAFUW7_01717 [Fulvia fulva]